MQFDSYCSRCQVLRQFEIGRRLLSTEDAHRYLLDVMDLIAHAPEGVSATYFTPLFQDALAKYGVTEDIYAEEKRWSNDLVLPLLPGLWRKVESSADPLLTAMKLAQMGNFLDFGVLRAEDVHENVQDVLARAETESLNEAEYRCFVEDLTKSKRLLIIGDNAGEIALDTLLVRQILRQFPHLHVTYGVRGGNALNDATREDAAYVGMDKLVPIVDNGSRISATELPYLGEEMRKELSASDMILTKGQANFESMATCGLNIYYNFLCKCERFARILGVELLTGVFLNERRLPPISIYP